MTSTHRTGLAIICPNGCNSGKIYVLANQVDRKQ
jgi:hypothetical protein